jgi:hypothetical protein
LNPGFGATDAGVSLFEVDLKNQRLKRLPSVRLKTCHPA